MSANGPERQKEFLAWLKARIESVGYTVQTAPDYLSKAYRSGNPKDLNALVLQEWYDFNNPGWSEEAWAKGGLRSRHGERHESPKLKRGYN